MSERTLFQRLLPAGMVSNAVVYNLCVLGPSLLAALVCFTLSTLAALLVSHRASKKLAAGMAGISSFSLWGWPGS